MASLFVSLSLCLDSQARCCTGGSVGYFWSDGYEHVGLWLVLRPGRKERAKEHLPHVACCTTTASSLFVAVGAFQGWIASLLSLPALEHHLVSLGVFVDVDRQES